MATCRTVGIVLALLCIMVVHVDAAPQPSAAYPYMVKLDISNFLLYTLAVKGMTGPSMKDEDIRSILSKLLDRHNMTMEHVDIPPVIKTLKQKFKSMYQASRKCWRAGGRSLAFQLEKWKKTEYTIKLPHTSGSPTKRKLENDLNEERNKRVNLEKELSSLNDRLENSNSTNQELERKINRMNDPIKRGKGQRGKGKGKDSIKKSQQYKNIAKGLNDIKASVEEKAQNIDMKPVGLQLRDKNGKLIKIAFEEDTGDKVTEQDIDEMLFILDAFNIPHKGYHEIAQRCPNLPRLTSITGRKQEINKTCPVEEFDIQFGEQQLTGVVRSVTECLTSILSLPEKQHLIEDGNVKIKLSGDGTRAGKKKHLVNFTFTIIGEDTCKSEQGNYLLAIVRCPETNECLKATLGGLIEEFDDLTSVVINGQVIQVEKYLGGDLKFLNQIMGIMSFSALYSCLWCKCDSELRFDMSKNWSMSDTNQGARTLQEITECARKKQFGCKTTPMFKSVPIVKVVPDTLHLYIRIADQLVYQIIKYLQDQDNFKKLKGDDKLKKCTHLQKFQNFIQEIGIRDWHFFIKDGKIDYDSFTGPEHREIMKSINLDQLIPNHPKLEGIKSLWTKFESLMAQLNQDMTDEDIDMFEQSAKEWVKLYAGRLYLSKDATPYMHILAFHLPEAMRLHGNVVDFCQQGLEKLNDMVTKWYFRSTNYDSTALKQIMHKQHRLRNLEGKCRREPKFQVTCSVCKHTGHNKRTCDEARNPRSV